MGRRGRFPIGGGLVLPRKAVVVTRPTRGEVKAFGIFCTHQGCRLDNVSGGTINCVCHGSKFSITTGEAVMGPATRPLPSKRTKIERRRVYVWM